VCRGRDRMLVGFRERGVKHYVLKFVCNMRQVGDFFPGPTVSSTNKTDRHDITEILLKVVLDTIKQANKQKTMLMHLCT